MGGYSAPDVLHGRLARWVDAGLIDHDQATRIEAAEAAAAVGGVLAGRALLVVEALGYLGGTLAIIAGFVAVAELWPDIPTGAQLSFAAARPRRQGSASTTTSAPRRWRSCAASRRPASVRSVNAIGYLQPLFHDQPRWPAAAAPRTFDLAGCSRLA